MIGWEGLLAEQRAYLDDFWAHADMELEGDPGIQQAVRFALFHVLQAGARAERHPIAAKGLTGPGYDGHAFWDTEIFVLPVLTLTFPRAAADALRWRHAILAKARAHAHELGLRRAAFPINADIAYALSWVLTRPEWSGGDLLQHVQRVFPGRSASSHLRTLQSGFRTIRTHVREIVEESWPEEVIQASRLIPLTPQEDQPPAEPRTDPVCSPTASAPRAQTGACVVLHQLTREEEAIRPPVCAHPVTNEHTQPLDEKGSQHVQTLQV